MEIKNPQTNTAGFSFDTNKQSEAEQNHRMKIKNQIAKKKKISFFLQSAAMGGKATKYFRRGSVCKWGFPERSLERRTQAPFWYTDVCAAGLTLRHTGHLSHVWDPEEWEQLHRS